MAIIDLIHCSPEELAELASLSDLMETIRNADRIDERQAQVLDYVYIYRVIRLIRFARRGENSTRELEDLFEHLDRVTHPRWLALLKNPERPYGARWTAYRDILENRLGALLSQVPERLLKRAHVEEILHLITKEKSISRKKIGKVLGLKQANLTRVLHMMEANELIDCHPIGRKIILTAGANAPGQSPTAENETEKPPNVIEFPQIAGANDARASHENDAYVAPHPRFGLCLVK